jgi:hypothetical protein
LYSLRKSAVANPELT